MTEWGNGAIRVASSVIRAEGSPVVRIGGGPASLSRGLGGSSPTPIAKHATGSAQGRAAATAMNDRVFIASGRTKARATNPTR